MTAADWIAVVQALALALAALFAWRTYQLATDEHREARDAARAAREEAERAPLRELLGDVARELKDLAAQAEERAPGVGVQRLDLVIGHQRRLAIALAFVPPDVFNLFATRDLTTRPAQEVNTAGIKTATTEILRLFADIEDGKFSIRQVRLPSQRP